MSLMKQVGLLIVLLVAIGLVLTFSNAWPYGPAQDRATRLPPVPPTSQQLAQLQNSPAFQYSVSYTAQGFEPSTLTVKKGETVRFTNNSSGDMWIASGGNDKAEVYPGSSSCGESAFDSCQPIIQGGYWEFTFQAAGTWQFQNNGDTQHTGTVVVTST